MLSTRARALAFAALLPSLLFTIRCAKPASQNAEGSLATRPSILLVTLDTTRADSIGPEAKGVETPAFNAVAARGRRFEQAYATVPQTLPSHGSMLTGLYPAGHGVHENARHVDERNPLISERLTAAGYRTAAFVSAYPLARRFGLARGFATYDDEFDAGRTERSAQQTTDRALAWLGQQSPEPVFVWVHYFEPHYPYEPPEPFRDKYANDPYRGEIAAMDQQLGRLIDAFSKRGEVAIILAGDHGEGLGEHGESQHGSLVYQSTMHVPLVIAGPGVAAGSVATPVSSRRIFHTILDWAGLGKDNSLRGDAKEVVLGESMIPFLQFGWQPQVMAVEGRRKAILAGRLEVYDVIADPGELHDLGEGSDITREVRKSIREYPIPSPAAPPPSRALGEEEQRQLASLGYITSDTKPVVRKDAPRPRDMAHLFDALDKASAAFTQGQYDLALPLLERVLADDPHNLMAALRIAAAHSALGHDAQALAAFRKSEAIAPDSEDVRNYLALHYARGNDWERAVPMLERVLADSPDRLPALEALAKLRERQGRPADALQLWQRVHSLRDATSPELATVGQLAMALGQTDVAIAAFEKERLLAGTKFRHDLELGVLYLSTRRFAEARDALDRVPSTHPDYAMALFKRAQVSVLLAEPDRASRIEKARANASPMTRELISRERLFAQ